MEHGWLLGYIRHGYDAAIVVTFSVVEFAHVGVYEWQRSPHSWDNKWLKVGIASSSILSAALGNKLLLD